MKWNRGDSASLEDVSSISTQYGWLYFVAQDYIDYNSGNINYNLGSGLMVIDKTQVNNSERAFALIAATNDTLTRTITVPDNMDMRYPFEVRVHWTGTTGVDTTDTLTVTPYYDIIAPNGTDQYASTATAGTACSADSPTTCYAAQMTDFGNIPASAFAALKSTDGLRIQLRLQCAISGFSADEAMIAGVDCRYTRRFL